jgi:hypothetical protein
MSTSFLDFNELKSRVSIEQVLQLLGITLKQHNSQMRGCCPIHRGTDQRGFVVTPAKGLYYCFGGCGGGDMMRRYDKARFQSAPVRRERSRTLDRRRYRYRSTEPYRSKERYSSPRTESGIQPAHLP